MGVLVFLEIWLQHFPEDFLVAATRINSTFSPSISNKTTKTNPQEFTYIQEFPPSPSCHQSKEIEETKTLTNWIDDSDDTIVTFELINFLRGFSSSQLYEYLGGKVKKIRRKSLKLDSNHNHSYHHHAHHIVSPTSITGKYIIQNPTQDFTALTIPDDSQLKIYFPVISSLLEVFYFLLFQLLALVLTFEIFLKNCFCFNY